MKQWLRRITALVLAAATLVTVAAAAEGDVPESGGRAARWLLQWTMGSWLPGDGLSLATVLTLRQSPMLLSAREAIAQASDTPEPDTPSDETPDAPEPSDTPEPEDGPLPQTPRAALAFQDNGVPSQTVKITNKAGYTVVRGVCIKNGSNKTLDAAALAEEGFAACLTDDAPQVLILHTHGSEAYTMPAGHDYVSTGTCRTSDTTKNVVRVGDEIASVLSGYGISVLHDRTLYDDPLYEGAYGRSVEGIEAYLEKYPSISFILDIHRDAVEDAQHRQYKLISLEDPNAAQLSFIMGSNHDGCHHGGLSHGAAAPHAAELQLSPAQVPGLHAGGGGRGGQLPGRGPQQRPHLRRRLRPGAAGHEGITSSRAIGTLRPALDTKGSPGHPLRGSLHSFSRRCLAL